MKSTAAPIALLLVCTSLLLPLAALAQGHAHEHGVARLDIAVEAGRISLLLEAPLNSLFGFERAPRTDAERKSAEAAVARLKAADILFQPEPAAGCTLASVELHSAVLSLGNAGPASTDSAHADLDASVEFQCKDAAKLTFIDSSLFSAFANMQRVDVQVAVRQGQFKRTLKRPAKRIELVR